MPQAALRTDRVELVPLADEHIELEVELDADPLVLRYLDPRARTRDEVVAAHAERMKRGTRVDGLGLWVGFTVRGAQREFVGLWMLQPPHGPSQPFAAGEADLGFRLLRRWWRQGYASEGARELLRHGFEDLGLTRIFAQTMAVNRPSRATLETLGMHHVRSFHEGYDEPVPGFEHGEVEYEIRRVDWPPPQTDTR
ncbi:GNAT family N-acetyltransferase [Actinophytocola sp.]|uniref:GNAT family N-acetyltransferase n=1 Tax=Actinophytocola sp. TaxID=1872138 RepID=UPI003899F983